MGRQFGETMASAELEKGWEAAEKSIADGEFDSALENLRLLDENGEHAMTWKLAGDCKKGIATESGLKKAYREANKHYQRALKIDPKFKDARVGLEGLQGEMTSEGVRERFIPKMIDDGTPTLFGIIAFPIILLGTLALIKVISDGTATETSFDYTATMNVQWIDDTGLMREDTITLELYYDESPIAVQNWLDHAEAGNYDGVRFHRVIDGFMLQTGDIEGKDGSGGYAYEFHGLCNGEASSDSNCGGAGKSAWTIPDEVNNGMKHGPGSLAMAKTSPPDTGGSQFYIVDKDGNTVPPSHLDGVHTVFGQVTEGMELIDAMGQVETGDGDKPVREMTITSIDFESSESKGVLHYLMFWNLF
ncbi:MAG: peptidylprolyl isomerase [Candidatus Poseidoniaceae archaeon]|jgi:cyclophilin family peptidyl-prolyl cis-trans isomerase|nr:peptidylprolyl isomerase [Candidatus Poseidoniaceae archaeon]